jgi:hypothetical protein
MGTCCVAHEAAESQALGVHRRSRKKARQIDPVERQRALEAYHQRPQSELKFRQRRPPPIFIEKDHTIPIALRREDDVNATSL